PAPGRADDQAEFPGLQREIHTTKSDCPGVAGAELFRQPAGQHCRGRFMPHGGFAVEPFQGRDHGVLLPAQPRNTMAGSTTRTRRALMMLVAITMTKIATPVPANAAQVMCRPASSVMLLVAMKKIAHRPTPNPKPMPPMSSDWRRIIRRMPPLGMPI